jgi:succinyl-diaminopimelate desuccinylase
MHKLDEAVALTDLVALTDVYEEILKRAFAA